MLALKFISLTLTGVTQELIIGVFLFVIFNLKIDWKKVFPYALIMGLSSSISYTFLAQSPSTVYFAIYIIMMLLSLIFIFRFSMLKSIAVTCMIYFLKAVVSLTSLTILKLSSNWTFSSLGEQLIGQIFGAIFLFLIVMVIMSFKIKIQIPKDLNKKRTLSIVINIILSVLLLFPNLFYIDNSIGFSSTPLYVYNSISLAIIVITNAFNSIRLGKMELLKQNLEFQELYTQNLNEMVNSLRGFKHDHNNMLQVIGGYISVNDMDGLRKFYSQMMSETRKINNLIPLNSYIKDNPAIYGLLLSKISYAEVKNVNLTINVICEIKLNNIKTYDLCKILGVLLDNAIEAAVETEKRFVELAIRENADKNRLFIEVNNSCAGDIDIETIFKDGYTTKKEHTGFGLWEIRNIVDKYKKNCKLHTQVKYNVFSQKLEIIY
ncbi:sensor histidine kinase [Acetivibrio cellulolyticus]|uniref:sensor histidine kinase n=1 Tax=Acetivibrio cellulolyticus TaxID=35830 RepID=UPI0001E301AC|nr:GHKL domain-containing protein [Acetivibrio cellulolyticus]